MTVTLQTPLGPLYVDSGESGLTGIRFGPYRRDPAMKGIRATGDRPAVESLRPLLDQLGRYFSGHPIEFSVPLNLEGYTDFQRAVWKAIRAVPSGRTTTYGALAGELGDRKAARAVGAALGQNPFPILIPCHRAIGSDGSLTGFGGGVEWKRALLSLEGGQKELF
jgi:methylated-DNA-[protein]-cysteine S-methyltransferase